MFNIFKKKTINTNLREKEKFIEELKGFKNESSDPAEFKRLGYPAWAVRAMGYSIEEMKAGGYSERALKNTEKNIKS